MKGFIRAITLTLFVAASPAFPEDEMRDFYAEPGMNPFRTAAPSRGRPTCQLIRPDAYEVPRTPAKFQRGSTAAGLSVPRLRVASSVRFLKTV